MSIMQGALNTALFCFLRPIMYTIPFNHLTMACPRTLINGLSLLNPNELKSSIMKFYIEDIPAEWIQSKYEIQDNSKCRVILYLHGGAYIAGSPMTHRQITSRLAKYNKARVLAIDYRQAPEHKWPAPQKDAITAYKWLLEEGYLPENIAFAGDSAGGNLCVTTTIMLREQNLPLPCSIALLSPWLDLSASGQSHTDNSGVDPFIPQSRMLEAASLYTELDKRDPRISPVFADPADLANLPPTLIHISDNEILLSDSETFYKNAKAAGVDITMKVFKNCCHVWQFFCGWDIIPEAVESLTEIVEFQSLHWKEKI